jgi:hypothetical protein
VLHFDSTLFIGLFAKTRLVLVKIFPQDFRFFAHFFVTPPRLWIIIAIVLRQLIVNLVVVVEIVGVSWQNMNVDVLEQIPFFTIKRSSKSHRNRLPCVRAVLHAQRRRTRRRHRLHHLLYLDRGLEQICHFFVGQIAQSLAQPYARNQNICNT